MSLSTLTDNKTRNIWCQTKKKQKKTRITIIISLTQSGQGGDRTARDSRLKTSLNSEFPSQELGMVSSRAGTYLRSINTPTFAWLQSAGELAANKR